MNAELEIRLDARHATAIFKRIAAVAKLIPKRNPRQNLVLKALGDTIRRAVVVVNKERHER